jgi:hypothetical protein
VAALLGGLVLWIAESSVGFIGKLICVSALWLPILSAQSAARHKAKVQLPQVASFERRISWSTDSTRAEERSTESS